MKVKTFDSDSPTERKAKLFASPGLGAGGSVGGVEPGALEDRRSQV